MFIRPALAALAAVLACAAGSAALGQQTPPPGYYDIPAGFDFPADKATLQGYADSGDLARQRLHAWNVFAGMTQPTPDGNAIFETWYSEREAFDPSATLQGVGPRRIVRDFRVPQQALGIPGGPILQGMQSPIPIAQVYFNFANFEHIRDQSKPLYLQATLTDLLSTGAPDVVAPSNKAIPPFPNNAVSLKTMWWPVAGDKLSSLPVWDPADNPAQPGGNGPETWKRVVAIDPLHATVAPNTFVSIQYRQVTFPNSHVVSLQDFHAFQINAATAAAIMSQPPLADLVRDVMGRPLQAGDYLALIGTHMTTKEIDNWVWATFWWHDQPDAGPFAADRPASVTGVWRNFLMSTAYDFELPLETDGSAHVAFNPYLEARFPRGGTVSNCMSCHSRAAFQNPGFMPITRGRPDLQGDPAYQAPRLRTDFLWSVLDNAS